MERNAVEEVLVPVAAREREPWGADCERRHPEPRVRRKKEPGALDGGELREDRTVERVDCGPPGLEQPADLLAADPADRPTPGRAKSSDECESDIGDAPLELVEDRLPGGKGRVEVPRAAPSRHHRDRRPPAELTCGLLSRLVRQVEAQLLVRRVGRRRDADDTLAQATAEMPARGLVVAPQPLEPLLLGIDRRGMVHDVVPVARHAAQRPSGIAVLRPEARVRDGERAFHAWDARRELGRRGAVQHEGDAQRGVCRVIRLTPPERLDDMADRVRVPVVDEKRRRPVGRASTPEDHAALHDGRRCHGRQTASVRWSGAQSSTPRFASSARILARSAESS